MALYYTCIYCCFAYVPRSKGDIFIYVSNLHLLFWRWHFWTGSTYCISLHWNDVKWMIWRLKSAAIRLFFNSFRWPPSQRISNSELLALCEGNPPITGAFPSQRASNAKNVFILRRHYVWKEKLLSYVHSPVLYFIMNCHWYTISLTTLAVCNPLETIAENPLFACTE